MTSSPVHSLMLLILTFVVAGGGAYLGSYLKQKGKNLATHEDINNLVGQVAAVTQTTKEIEAKISNEMWDRQRRWELKTQAMFEAIKRMTSVKEALTGMLAVYRNNAQSEAPLSDERASKQTEAYKALNEAVNGLEQAAFTAQLVCGAEIFVALSMLALFARDTAGEMTDARPEVFNEAFNKATEIGARIVTVTKLMQKELGLT